MAVDVCTEISSPRISFSYDLKELDIVPVEDHNRRSDSLLLNPTVDFDFCVDGHCFLSHEISSADELFANGKILPIDMININNPLPKDDQEIHQAETEPPLLSHSNKPHKNGVGVVGNENNSAKKKIRLIEFLSNSLDAEDDEEDNNEKPLSSSKQSFWQFKRSSSDVINCENGRPNGLFRFLTRSNSTGSVSSPKQRPSGFPKAIQKQHSLKEESINYRSNSSVSSFNHYYYPNNNNNNTTSSKKPSLGKNITSKSYGNYNNGVRINPVLNIPPAYIAKGTVSLFGIGSFFCSKKSKKKR